MKRKLEHVTWAGDTNQGVAFETQLLVAQLQPSLRRHVRLTFRGVLPRHAAAHLDMSPKLHSCRGSGSVPGGEPSCVHGTQRLPSPRAGA